MKQTTLIRKLIARLGEGGFDFTGVHDFEELHRPATVKEALFIISNLDECNLHFQKQGFSAHFVKLVLDFDQDAEDVIADWSFSEGDGDKFDETISKFCDEVCS